MRFIGAKNIVVLSTFFQIFVLTIGKFVARTEGKGFNPTCENNNWKQLGTYFICVQEKNTKTATN